ncbi:uncharacterized protein LOC121405889 [Lytechinus variegatus]|uniref:uncharacterized protein LOC121405889 n=1 Tax=Lytechinus variegatus TaxID=7654 RepID=UPI001BB1A637|nr:uncharacterized protein LOC121405889 [Lytechinus variegatus]
MATSLTSVVIALLVIIGQLITVKSSGSTIITTLNGWSAMEGSNFTLACKVSLTNNVIAADTICRTRIRFTRNSTGIAEDTRHIRSGATRDSVTNRINCTMTIFRLRSEDSGLYGCCWPDVEGNCSRHPTRMLRVIPATTTSAPTTPSITSTEPSTSPPNTQPGSRTPSEHNGIVYHSVSPKDGSTLPGGDNEAYNQRLRPSSVHKAIWPILFVIAVIVIIVLLWKRYVKSRPSDGHTIPEKEPESPTHVAVLDHTVAYDMDGVVATTTTTTTTVLNRTVDEESQR